MPRPDVDALSPADAVVALRSFPRRYREALTDAETGRLVDEVAWAPGPDGVSPMALVIDTVRSLALLDRAFEQTLVEDRPALLSAVVDPTQRHFEPAPNQDLDDLLIELGLVASTLADRVERTHGDEWNRGADIVGGSGGGGEVDALSIVREAVRTAADNLRALGPLIRSLFG